MDGTPTLICTYIIYVYIHSAYIYNISLHISMFYLHLYILKLQTKCISIYLSVFIYIVYLNMPFDANIEFHSYYQFQLIKSWISTSMSLSKRKCKYTYFKLNVVVFAVVNCSFVKMLSLKKQHCPLCSISVLILKPSFLKRP